MGWQAKFAKCAAVRGEFGLVGRSVLLITFCRRLNDVK
jgi:hypothetical protein